MVPGFNTDFKYRGETYHVQTEDNGVSNPVVVSLLYHKGAILASRRTPYNDLVGKPGFEQELKTLMKNQHKDLMKSLLAGAFDKDGTAPAVIGGTGEDPAAAAAAIAQSTAAATPPVPPPPRPAAPPPPLRAKSAPQPTPEPLIGHLPGVALPITPSAPAAPALTTAPRPTSFTLDEAIMRYLEEFAATATAAPH